MTKKIDDYRKNHCNRADNDFGMCCRNEISHENLPHHWDKKLDSIQSLHDESGRAKLKEMIRGNITLLDPDN